jgi:hypothetical protein
MLPLDGLVAQVNVLEVALGEFQLAVICACFDQREQFIGIEGRELSHLEANICPMKREVMIRVS